MVIKQFVHNSGVVGSREDPGSIQVRKKKPTRWKDKEETSREITKQWRLISLSIPKTFYQADLGSMKHVEDSAEVPEDANFRISNKELNWRTRFYPRPLLFWQTIGQSRFIWATVSVLSLQVKPWRFWNLKTSAHLANSRQQFCGLFFTGLHSASWGNRELATIPKSILNMSILYIWWEPQRQSFEPLNFGSWVFLEISSVLLNRNQEIAFEGGY